MADKISPEKLAELKSLGYKGDDSLEFLMLRINDLMIAENAYMVATKDGDTQPWWSVAKDKDKAKAKAKKFIDVIADELEQKLIDKAKDT